jgi:hypothetical protein
MDDAHFAGIHAAITALSVDVGRLSERLIALDSKLVHHTHFEHEEFKEALQIVDSIKKDVGAIQTVLNQQQGAWWALIKVGGVILALAGLITWVVEAIRR